MCIVVLTNATPYALIFPTILLIGFKEFRMQQHISPLLQNLHRLPVIRRTLHKVTALCHTSLSGSGPQYLSDLTHVYTPARSLRSSSNTRILSTPNVQLKSYGQRSFAYHGPTTCNSLPLAHRYQQELDCFKRALKTHLFSLN